MKSMTGFGRANLESNGRNYIIDIKTVNNRYNDISVKMPRSISFIEEKVRKEIAKNVTRGKIDVIISFFDFSNESKNIVLNKEVAKEYIQQLKQIVNENGLTENINIVEIAKLPDVLNSMDTNDTEQITEETLKCLRLAINNLVDMRTKEGENIKQDLKQRLSRVEQLINQISMESTGLIEEYVVKLEKRVKELLKTETIDENRIAQEAVIYADKTSIEEELTRLKSHIAQFNDLLENTEKPVGKKLDFIIQEMNRETNTIGSKSGSNNITNLVIDMKVELEDIREQIQNIE